MSKKDDIKEQIGMLKFWLGVLVGSVLAVVGWAVTNFETANRLISAICMVAMLFCIPLIALKAVLDTDKD